MNIFLRWILQFKLRARTIGYFHAHLNRIARTLDKSTLSETERGVWQLAQSYWRDDVAHYWTANCTQGAGNTFLGVLKRDAALTKLANMIPRSAVISVDDNYHFIFYKLVE